jgi:hypothetical protein
VPAAKSSIHGPLLSSALLQNWRDAANVGFRSLSGVAPGQNDVRYALESDIGRA